MKGWKFVALWAFILVVIVPLFYSLLLVPLFYSLLPVTEPEKEYPLLPPVAPPRNVKNATLIPAPPGWDRRYGRSIAPGILGAVFLLICAVAFYLVGRKTQKADLSHSIAIEKSLGRS